MAKYRKKPRVIDAAPVTWDGRRELCELLGDFLDEASPLRHDGVRPPEFTLPFRTMEGTMTARWEDGLPVQWWIIKGVQGEFYPCKADIFEDSYERVEEACPA